jgi:hypothetical protein
MFKLLKLLRLLNQYQPASAVDWTEGDAKNLSAFFGTKTGSKLEAISHDHIARSCMNACAAKYDADRHVAQGIRITWTTIASLQFRTPQSQEGNTEGDDDRIPEAFQ